MKLFGFQKDELAMVWGVVIVIFVISFGQLRIGQIKTRDAQRKADVELVSRVLRAYREDHIVLPMEATGSGKILSCGKNGASVCEWGKGKIVDDRNVVYMEKLPIDPFDYKGWRYIYDGSKLYVSLENKKDKGIRKNLTLQCGDEVQCNWYVEI